MKLYKYRSISGDAFKYTQDIFINRRLFVPSASALNDPNEGVAFVDVQNQYGFWANQLEERNRRNTIGLCAFSECHKNSVVWSHYADEHRGICIEFDSDEMDVTKGILKQVNYSNNVPQLSHNPSYDLSDAFLNKTSEWQYEKEWRFISIDNGSFLEFSRTAILRVLLGSRFQPSELQWVKFWLSHYNPSAPPPVVKMTHASTDYCLYEESEMVGKLSRMA